MMDVRPALVLFAALLLACEAPASAPPVPRVLNSVPVADVATAQEDLSLEVIELMCSPCAAQIVSKSRQLPGVTHVSMVLATKTLTVRFDTTQTARERVIASVEQIVASVQ
jgi:copper chaperone CopZ